MERTANNSDGGGRQPFSAIPVGPFDQILLRSYTWVREGALTKSERVVMRTSDLKRREFLLAVASALGSLATTSAVSARAAPLAEAPTIQGFVDSIVAAVGTTVPQTVDTFKAGDPNQVVRGVATTFLATCEVIEKARALGANLIITHEPTFYNHLDEVDWLGGDPVYRYKTDLLRESGIAVWRFHDYWHRVKPDPVTEALCQELDLRGPAVEGATSVRTLPEVPLRELALTLKKRLELSLVRVIGDPALPCRRVAVLPGAWGGRPQIETLSRHRPDVLICGEINEWETNIYVKDAISAGIKTGLVILGHVNTEEAGMRALVDWLKLRFPGVPVQHVPMGDPFRYL